MALNPPTLFGDAVRSVFVRCSFSTSGNQSAAYRELVQEMVRSAHTQLYPEAEWTPAIVREEFALADGVQTYDFPDTIMPGRINAVTVTNDSGREVEVEIAATRPNERDAARSEGVVRTGCPVLVSFVGQDMEFWPAPDETWVSATIDGVASSLTLRDDADPLVVDGELVIQAATMKFKRHLGLPVSRDDMAEHERYLARVKAMQSNGGGWQFGGRQAPKVSVQKRNRIGLQYRRTGNAATDTPDWNPF